MSATEQQRSTIRSVTILCDEPDAMSGLIDRLRSGWPGLAISTGKLQASADSGSGGTVASIPPADAMLLRLGTVGDDARARVELVRARHGSAPIVIAGGQFDVEGVREAVNAGAAGVVPETAKPRALASAIMLAVEGEPFVPAHLLHGPSGGDTAEAADLKVRLDRLTERERAVLTLLTKGASNKEIARELSIQEITVKSHMKAIFRKLEVRNRTHAARLALTSGLFH